MDTMTIPPVMTPEQLSGLMHTGAPVRLLDVRTPGEYEAVHIVGSYNVPLDQLAEHAAEIRSVEAPMVLICRSGQRSRKAEAALKAGGMQTLHVLDGGLQAWEAAGLSVRRGAERISLERQVRIAAGGLAAVGGLLALLVSPLFAIVPLVIGGGLVFAGVTDTCGMAMLLAKLPYNRTAQCDVRAMVRALSEGAEAR